MLVGELSADGREFDAFSILRPTSPFRGAATIRRAWERFLEVGEADSLRAVERCRQHPGKMWVLEGELMRPLLPQPEGTPYHSRQYQALPEVYVQNSSLEIAWSRVATQHGTIAGERVVPFFTEGVEGFSIDYPDDVERAERLTDEAEALQGLSDPPDWDDVAVERTRGEIARRAGHPKTAVAIAERALQHDLTDRGRSRMYNLLGSARAALDDLEAAYDACARELELGRALGDDSSVATALGNLAEIALRLGDFDDAARNQRACLDLAVARGSSTMVAFSLIVAARLAGVAHEWADAVRLQARAETLLEDIGLVLYDDDRREIEAMLVAARDELGTERYTAAYDDGCGLELAAAIAEADRVLAATEARATG
jgi:tetratricopeptide (TPR) repeat protein